MLSILFGLLIQSVDAGVLGKYSFSGSSCGGDYLNFEQGTMELYQNYSRQYKVRLIYIEGQSCLDIYNTELTSYMGVLCPIIADGSQLVFRMEMVGQGSDLYKAYKCR